MTKFSVITVCYNSEKTIAETIQSVKKQSFKDYEHLIVDGLSSDNTGKIVDAHKDNKIAFVSEKDNGLYDAMNKGILKANGEYIVFLNSDDFFADEYVLQKVDLISSSLPDFIYGGIRYFSENQKGARTWMPENFTTIKHKKLQIPHPGVFIRREHIIENKRLFDTTLQIAADLKQQLELIHIDNRTGMLAREILVNMRLGGKSTDGILAFIRGWKESLRVYVELFGVIGIYYCCRKVLHKLPQISNKVQY
ncbi:hypothetical protein UF64_00215 [Thalassospira sp. HJ]|uniref:glycosyltransferase family 2 protein n=1 Tax=Thalassospira sp. HJ TaxID=1616823 RepID=UPI0005CDEE6A|nr:glycosyltransferase family 2 protein [Thalassospira sp. HJ]KJE37149.1 hypothetical protein UF64_00215 [Thalassospira sp. HJ]